MTKTTTFHLVSLGCAKNTVDSDSMAQLLVRDGYHSTDDPEKANVLIVNTCGFIGPARDESFDALRELAEIKRDGQILIAAGCLTQRYGAEVAAKVPGVDGVLGTRRWMDIVQVVRKLRERPHPSIALRQAPPSGTSQDGDSHRPGALSGGLRPEPLYHLPGEAQTVGTDEHNVLRASVAGASAYLKIADGCRRPCAFCAIPLIKGTAVSRPLETILDEARRLRDAGVRELILIAQDTTDYGHDLGMKDGLAILLERLVDEVASESPYPTGRGVRGEGLDWIRIMYAYPGFVTDRLIDLMASREQILPYLDMPLQHAHPKTLYRMKRPSNMDWVYRTLSKMRAKIPSLSIRTTFIVGYPGETDKEYQALVDFVEEIRFDRVGAFQFSFEEGTSSAPLGDPVPASVKQKRFEHLMELQQGISLQINQSFVGKTLDVLVEGFDNGISVGRSYRDAPEIDGLVFIEGRLELGQIVPVRITGAMAYDLTGVPAVQDPIKL